MTSLVGEDVADIMEQTHWTPYFEPREPDPVQLKSNEILEAIMKEMNVQRVCVEEMRRVQRIPLKEEKTEFHAIPKPTQLKATDTTRKIIRHLLKSAEDENTEVELSFGSLFDGKFKPGINGTDFMNAKSLLTQSDKFDINRSFDTVEIMTDGNRRMRLITDEDDNSRFEIKTRDFDKSTIIPEFAARLSISKEEEEEYFPDVWIPQLVRKRTRYTFTPNSAKSVFAGIKIDMTIVATSSVVYEEKEGDKIPIFSQEKISFELELELEKIVSISKFMKAASKVYSMITQNLMDGSRFSVTPEEKEYIIRTHNILVGVPIEKAASQTYMVSSYMNKPVNIALKDLQPKKSKQKTYALAVSNSYPTVKLNGKRFFLFISDGVCWLVYPPNIVYKFGETESVEGTKTHVHDKTLLDGELLLSTESGQISYEYHAFDILYYGGTNLTRKPFIERLESARYAVESIVPFGESSISLKKYYTDGTFFERSSDAYKEYASLPEGRADGLIIQPSGVYKNNETFKWKPPEELTIDFRYQRTESENVFNLLVGKGNEEIIFTPKGFKGTVTVQNAVIDGTEITDLIVESKWDQDNKTFVPIKIREDKVAPNYINVAYNVWNDITHPISSETITGNDLMILRKYINSQKRSDIFEYFGRDTVLLDIGSGRGGDITKWREAGVGHVYAVEPSLDNIKIFRSRMKTELRRKTVHGLKADVFKNSVTVLNYGAQNTTKIEVDTIGTGITDIAAFSSLTFFFESEDLYSKLLRTLNLVPPGGRVVGIVMDGEKTRELLEENDGFYSNGPVEIKSLDSTDSDFGNKIHIKLKDSTSMVNYEEYLFMYDAFKESMSEMWFAEEHMEFLGGPQAECFPEANKEFANLHRKFVFIKKETADLPEGDDWEPLFNSYDPDLLIGKVDQHSSGFLSAFMEAMGILDGKESVDKMRRELSDEVTIDTFKSLMGGEYAERAAYAHKMEVDPMESAFNEFKSNIINEHFRIAETSLLEILSRKFSVSIYLIGGTSVSMPLILHPDKNAYMELLKLYEDAVVLMRVGEIYYVVGRFAEDDEGNPWVPTLFENHESEFLAEIRENYDPEEGDFDETE